MIPHNISVTPKFKPALEPEFVPAALFNRAYRAELECSGQGMPLIIGIERGDSNSCYETAVFKPEHPWATYNNYYVERIVKFLLWQRGGYKVSIGGPPEIGAQIQQTYSPGGKREFDYRFMGEQVYERNFEVVSCGPEQVPPANDQAKALGRHLDG